MSRINLLNYTTEELKSHLVTLGEKSFRATQLINWIHQLGNRDFCTMSNLSLKFREYLANHCSVVIPEMINEQISVDGTKKWLFKLVDGELIETVFIPDNHRGTLCVSSQVGCSVGCPFCATGKQGLKRNLETAEIIGQLWFAVNKLAPQSGVKSHVITNLVFMGMGEPLLNYNNVLKATKLALDDNAYGLSKYRVTLSTCGIIPEITKLKMDSEISLAISLHAANNELRDRLVPINRKYPVEKLVKICDHYFKDRRRKTTVEYIMLDGINDTPVHAKQLIKLLSNGNYKINLIPGHVIDDPNFRGSSQRNLEIFQDLLMKARIDVRTRKSRGIDIMAACGQLKGEITASE